jgi:hypothetical protein
MQPVRPKSALPITLDGSRLVHREVVDETRGRFEESKIDHLAISARRRHRTAPTNLAASLTLLRP